MQITSFSILALFAASGAIALPAEQNAAGSSHVIMARCDAADKPLCGGAQDLGEDNCFCKGQKEPCGNWKCPWDGKNSIMNCGSLGSGCQWIN